MISKGTMPACMISAELFLSQASKVAPDRNP